MRQAGNMSSKLTNNTGRKDGKARLVQKLQRLDFYKAVSKVIVMEFPSITFSGYLIVRLDTPVKKISRCAWM